MNDLNRNSRTLIVSFVVAIMALIPLRFLEVSGENTYLGQSAQVLGETSSSLVETREVGYENAPRLEAPYNEIESVGCMSEEMVLDMEKDLSQKLEGNTLERDEVVELLNELKEAELNLCK